MVPDIYAFSSFRKFLTGYYTAKKDADPRYTYKNFSAEIGITTSLLALIVTGRRQTTPAVLKKISGALGFSDDYVAYAEVMCGYDRAASDKERKEKVDKMRVLQRTHTQVQTLGGEQFDCFSDWRNIAILEMTGLPDFDPDPEWVARRLGIPEEKDAVAERLARLVDEGLLEKDGDGRLQPKTYLIVTPQDAPNSVIRKYHNQLLDIAKEAQESQSVEDRFFNGVTLNIHPSKLAAAKAVLKRAISEVIQISSETTGTETYHLSVQLFRLTEPTMATTSDQPRDDL